MKIMFATALGLIMAAPAYATEAVWQLVNPPTIVGNIGSTYTYTADGFHVTATGYLELTGPNAWVSEPLVCQERNWR